MFVVDDKNAKPDANEAFGSYHVRMRLVKLFEHGPYIVEGLVVEVSGDHEQDHPLFGPTASESGDVGRGFFAIRAPKQVLFLAH